jgi:hypothetical protein
MFISCIKSKKTTETAVICHVWVPCCVVSYDFRIKLCSVRLYFKLFVGGLVSYLRDLYLFANSGAQHILCCVLVFLRLVYPMFPILWIVHYWLPKVFSKIYFLSSDLHQCLQLLKLWVRLLSMVMCTRCNKFIKNVYLSSMVCGLFPITKLISMR